MAYDPERAELEAEYYGQHDNRSSQYSALDPAYEAWCDDIAIYEETPEEAFNKLEPDPNDWDHEADPEVPF